MAPLRIAVVGAESSGKTTLAFALGRALGAQVVEEFARTHLTLHGPRYGEADLPLIARGQAHAEEEAAGLAARHGRAFLVCDTDLITVRIWSEEKFGRCDPWVLQASEQRSYALWLLCRPDIPWEPDPLREDPHDRERLFARYEALLRAQGRTHAVVGGALEDRLRQALAAVGGLAAG